MAAPFVPGLRLSRAFFTTAVEPLLHEALPGLRYAAARLGPGSEVLGFDSPRSTDHDWGPRLEIFCSPDDVARHGDDLSRMLARRLPKRFLGQPTHFSPPGARVRVPADTDGPVAHLVRIVDLGGWCAERLGFDPGAALSTLDWLATPAQRLAETTGGAVFRDDDAALSTLRRKLRWYPDDLWRYLLGCQWARIGQEEAFVARAAEADDEVGSRVLTARLVRDALRLCLLLARRYPPYGKWLGSAVARVPAAAPVLGAARDAVDARDAQVRQAALCAAYETLGEWQNALGLATPVAAVRRRFHDRPYQVIDAQRFADALAATITDPEVAELPPVGSVDQFVDSTQVLSHPPLCRAAARAVLLPNHV